MRILAVDSGASFSTADVFRGLMTALARTGQHEVIHYPLARGMALGMEYCRVLQRKKYMETVGPGDVQYIAGVFALDRALQHHVDWVLITSATFFHIDFIIKLKFAGMRVGIIFTESPYESEQEWERARFADVVFTNERTTAERMQRLGHPSAHYLPHAYDPERHRPDLPTDEDVPAHDVVFVGTGWPERIKLFEAVNWDGIDFGLYGTWHKVAKRSPLRQYIHDDPIPNAQTAALYRKAKIGLNLHRFHETAESLNPRAYELAASGLFHLSDARAEVGERFRSYVPTFSTARELEELIRFYLSQAEERKRRAFVLPQLVSGETFDARARVVADAVERAAMREVVPV